MVVVASTTSGMAPSDEAGHAGMKAAAPLEEAEIRSGCAPTKAPGQNGGHATAAGMAPVNPGEGGFDTSRRT